MAGISRPANGKTICKKHCSGSWLTLFVKLERKEATKRNEDRISGSLARGFIGTVYCITTICNN